MYCMNSKMRCRPTSQAWKHMQTHMSSVLNSCVLFHSYSQLVDSFRLRLHLSGKIHYQYLKLEGLQVYQHPNRIQSELSKPELSEMNKLIKTNRNNQTHRCRWVTTDIKGDPESIADHKLDLSQQYWVKKYKHADTYTRAQFVNLGTRQILSCVLFWASFLMRTEQ